MPSRVPTGAMLAGVMVVTGALSSMTPTSFQFLGSVKPEYSGWVYAVPDTKPAALSSASV